MMDDSNDIEVNNKTRYIRFTPNSNAADSIESERRESEEATGGEPPAGETVAEQIFLETTVWIENSKNNRQQKKHATFCCVKYLSHY